MARIDPSSLPSQLRSLVADADGRLMLNGGDVPQREQNFAMSMSMPAARNTSSTSMAIVIDAEVQRILKEGYAMAKSILSEHADQLIRLADELMEHEQLDRKQFEALFQE
jgi:cell division protease FtsH